jgi:chemotaxis protein histidine kinase CheA
MDVVRRDVQAPGGQVEIHSKRGRGARVTITLSLAVTNDLPGIVRASANQQAA